MGSDTLAIACVQSTEARPVGKNPEKPGAQWSFPAPRIRWFVSGWLSGIARLQLPFQFLKDFGERRNSLFNPCSININMRHEPDAAIR